MNNHSSFESTPPHPASQTKKRYSKPTLFAYGDFRDVTLGSSPGVTDSGGQGAMRTQPNGMDLLLYPDAPRIVEP